MHTKNEELLGIQLMHTFQPNSHISLSYYETVRYKNISFESRETSLLMYSYVRACWLLRGGGIVPEKCRSAETSVIFTETMREHKEEAQPEHYKAQQQTLFAQPL